MMVLSIRHRTAYRYHQAVQLGRHRLMLRPRESRDLRLISSAVTASPQASVTWAHDVFGNTIATASFEGWSDSLVIESAVQLELFAPMWPEFDVAASAKSIEKVEKDLAALDFSRVLYDWDCL